MAEYKSSSGIRNFTPDDTPDKVHIQSSDFLTLGDVMAAARKHFGEDIDLEDLSIEAENIQTRCLGHDQHDYQDYDDFIILSRSA